MMPTELTPQETFEQKIRERVRADIGELLPDEALKALIVKAIEKIFFERPLERFGTPTQYSWFETEVKNMLRERIREAVQAHFKENGERIAANCASVIQAEAPKIMGEVIVGLITGSIQNMTFAFDQALKQRLGF